MGDMLVFGKISGCIEAKVKNFGGSLFCRDAFLAVDF